MRTNAALVRARASLLVGAAEEVLLGGGAAGADGDGAVGGVAERPAGLAHVGDGVVHDDGQRCVEGG